VLRPQCEKRISDATRSLLRAHLHAIKVELEEKARVTSISARAYIN
jgi:hypothetical protein